MPLRGDATPEVPAALGQVDRLQNTIDTLLAAAPSFGAALLLVRGMLGPTSASLTPETPVDAARA